MIVAGYLQRFSKICVRASRSSVLNLIFKVALASSGFGRSCVRTSTTPSFYLVTYILNNAKPLEFVSLETFRRFDEVDDEMLLKTEKLMLFLLGL